MNIKYWLARHLLKRRYKPETRPVVVGSRKWEYVKKPRGWKRWFKRPRIKYVDGFTYYYQGSKPIEIPKGMSSDSFTMPWVLVIASAGFFDYIMERIVWVSGVHDRACESKIYDRSTRADIFRECIWFAFDELNDDIEARYADDKKSKLGKIGQKILKTIARANAKIRNVALVGGVKVGSWFFGYC